ncbi:hypothetical protein [Spiroplasma turonicum]|uniref:Uncharacterized protein n=1 Tax=Spiroplasma turonicum TaxID=216946 RepID=A0A0K1P5S3_9MOLU|nr:hypothetical protein [Spiroplasma turonicum]AKU79658.1 hypothetical protein STURON_00412 [Spiroplasma turonicum]ALX70678.1 hypothetical protein STURO_v1c04100 [Spiroplasma turonicum]
MGFEDTNVEFSDSINKKGEVKLREVKKPKVLEENFSRIDSIKQARVLLSSKNGKANLSSLPDGMKRSIESKERLDKIIHNKEHNSADEIRKRLNIEGKPLTKKRAEELKESRLKFFQNNIDKSKSGPLNKVPDLNKPAALKSKKSSLSFRDKKIEEINKTNNVIKKDKVSKTAKTNVEKKKTIKNTSSSKEKNK